MATRIGITGSTGHIGGQVARALAAKGVPQRLIVRDPARAPQLPDAEVVRASYDVRDALLAALDGLDLVFMVSASESATRLDDHKTFVQAAADAGVKHLVYTSFAAADPNATFTLARDHYATEQAIKGSGMAFTLLRDNFYGDAVLDFADDTGTIVGPAADGRCAFVMRSDVAEAAATILLNPDDHLTATYTLTGPESLNFDEAAAAASKATGRRFRFVNQTVDQAYETRRRDWPGYEDWQYDAWVSTYTAVASGVFDEVTDDLPALLGRPATSLQDGMAALDAARH